MEPTAVALHLRTSDRVRVLDALRGVLAAEGLAPDPDGGPGEVRFLVSPTRGAWTSVFPEEAAFATPIAAALAAEVGVPVVAAGHFDEAAFFLVAFDRRGARVDDYHSCPDYAKEALEDDAGQDELDRTRGDAEALTGLLGGDAAAVASALAAARIERLRDHDAAGPPGDAVAAAAAIARELGLPDLLEGFEDQACLEEEGADVRSVTFASPEEPSALRRLLGRLEARWRGRAAAGRESPPGDEETPRPPRGEDAEGEAS